MPGWQGRGPGSPSTRIIQRLSERLCCFLYAGRVEELRCKRPRRAGRCRRLPDRSYRDPANGALGDDANIGQSIETRTVQSCRVDAGGRSVGRPSPDRRAQSGERTGGCARSQHRAAVGGTATLCRGQAWRSAGPYAIGRQIALDAMRAIASDKTLASNLSDSRRVDMSVRSTYWSEYGYSGSSASASDIPNTITRRSNRFR